MLNLPPEKRRHTLRMKQLDKARKEAKRRHNLRMTRLDEARKAAGWKDKDESKRDFGGIKLKWGGKLHSFIFPTEAILVEKNRHATLRTDVFVAFDKHGNVEYVIGADDNVDYTYLLDDPKYDASLVEPLTQGVIANSRIVDPVTGNFFRHPLVASFGVRLFKICVFLIVSEAIFPILWAYDLFKSYEESEADESNINGILWTAWGLLKLVWYPFFLVYYVIKDCRDIQANTPWWPLLKRLFE